MSNLPVLPDGTFQKCLSPSSCCHSALISYLVKKSEVIWGTCSPLWSMPTATSLSEACSRLPSAFLPTQLQFSLYTVWFPLVHKYGAISLRVFILLSLSLVFLFLSLSLSFTRHAHTHAHTHAEHTHLTLLTHLSLQICHHLSWFLSVSYLYFFYLTILRS